MCLQHEGSGWACKQATTAAQQQVTGTVQLLALIPYKHPVTKGSLASKEKGRFKMGTGLHMTYHLLFCPFAQNANRKQKGGENPEDSELKYIF